MKELKQQAFTSESMQDHIDQAVVIYQKAFAGYPWYEDLSLEEVRKRIDKDRIYDSFSGVAFYEVDKLVGASWYIEATMDYLRKEKGEKLAEFTESLISNLNGANQNIEIVWHTITIVDPDSQGEGIGKELKRVIFEDLQNKADKSDKIIIYLTRIRDDNFGSIKMNIPYGLQRTGIKVPSSQVIGLLHEYWYKAIIPNSL